MSKRRYLKVPEGDYEFEGSRVIDCKRYYEGDCVVEEIWTEDGGHYMAKGRPDEMDLEELKNLIESELSL